MSLKKKAKYAVPWTYIINDLNGEQIAGTFYKGELQKKQLKNSLKVEKVEKVIDRKGYKPYVKWKSNDSSFNSWIDKKHSINK